MKHLFVLLFAVISSSVLAQPYAGPGKPELPKNVAKAAGCIPPSATTRMELNNVRMLVHTAGNMWQVPNQNLSMYEVPKNSGVMALFTSALWLGGTDANDQLKLAALRYRNGQDYWTGPLSQGDAVTDNDQCLKYDQHYVTVQDEIRNFTAWYQAGERDAENGTNEQATQFPNYEIPRIIKEWPAHGDISLGQDYYLAPFFDYNKDGNYNYEDGDYPWHDIERTKACGIDREVSLYGDLNYWWVMNDKGNIHTETGADPIGMEIRGQAFCFASNDEINNMTFYNYELINRGSLTLFNTYFGFFTDGALGDPFDDYVGCDVNRGLAYYYNGENFDADNAGFKGYGNAPPAVGVDFFEGPYQDDDGLDNAVGILEGEALNGIGYGDGIVDNERFGMRRFLYYSNTTNGADPSQTDPISAADYYNYLRGIWKDNTPFYYGGSGHISDQDANASVPCDFMFPGDTDPLGWGTNGVPQAPWTEQTAGNVPNDRRFVQSAGPFVLTPGAVNNITVGVVYARSPDGDPFASVEVLRRADDKAQSLFENCFKIIDAPHAPELSAQELENEVILYLNNPINSNNYQEKYEEVDPFIISEDENVDRTYRFQGYQIYQLVNTEVSPADLQDPSKARLVAQCDIKDEVSRLVNFEFDQILGASVPTEMVDGANEGIQYSFQVKEDLFAQGDRRLVNFKRYYYMAVAYAYNNYKEYIPGDADALDGQKKPYLQSRKAPIGEIKFIEVIPHNPRPENGGTQAFLGYGTTPEIKRLDGTGNGNRFLELTADSEAEILSNGRMDAPIYKSGSGPINVKVVDPLNLKSGYFELKFKDYQAGSNNAADTAEWVIYRYDRENGTLQDSITSEVSIDLNFEQIIPQWGVSVQIVQTIYEQYESGGGAPSEVTTNVIASNLEFADSSQRWLTFIQDQDGFTPLNWIRSGSFFPDPADDPFVAANGFANPLCYKDETFDQDREWMNIVEGGWAPHALVGYQCDYMPLAYYSNSPNYPNSAELPSSGRTIAGLAYSPSIDVVITSDQSKWTRCPVIELGRDESLNIGGAKPGERRKSPSVDKNGLPTTGTGMGWFPGYAIDVETGARLYMAFGENSFLGQDGGNDMIWNPSERLFTNIGAPVLGGMQPIYVFSADQKKTNGYALAYDMGPYEESNAELITLLDQVEANNGGAKRNFYGSLSWVGYPLLQDGYDRMATDVRMQIRINKAYKDYLATGSNNGRPHYSWNMDNTATKTDDRSALAEALKMINVVPNPYYAYSEYERGRLDNRVKITNLPERCTVKIYQTNGKLVKTYKKDSPVTFLDWDLKNFREIPVASGVYLIHVEVPGVGEVIVKSYIAMREVDLEGI